MFEESHEIKYLDTAIGFAEELVLSDESAREILNSLLDLRKLHDPLGKGLGTSRQNDQQGEDITQTPETPTNTPGASTNIRNHFAMIRFLDVTFDKTGEVDCLDKAIALVKEHMASDPSGRISQDELLYWLVILEKKIDCREGGGDLAGATDLAKHVIAAVSPNNPHCAAILNNLSMTIGDRYHRLGHKQDLEQAVKWGEEAIAKTPLENPDRAPMLSNLGNMLGTRFKRLGNPKDLERAIQLNEGAATTTPPDHPERAGRLMNLSNQFESRFEWFGNPKDIERAIQLSEEAVTTTPPGHPRRAGILMNLSNQLGRRFGQLGDLKDLERAIQLNEEAVTATPLEHPWRAQGLMNLSSRLGSRFERLGNPEDLDRAIQLNEEALAATPPDHPRRAGILMNLSSRLGHRFKRLGNPEDLERAIQLSEEAVTATSQTHPNRATRLSNLGHQLLIKYNHSGDLNILERAIKQTEEAVTSTPPDHPGRAGMLNNLSNMLGSKYSRLGDVQDLEQAIQASEDAATATPLDDPRRVGILNTLSVMFRSRYDRLGELQDLEKAIRQMEQAVAATPPDHPDRAGLLNNLSTQLERRYDRLGELQDLERAIMRSEEAVAAFLGNHSDRAGILNHLSNKLESRYNRLGELQDLERAIQLSEEVLAAIPPDHPDHFKMMASLSNKLQSRYIMLGHLEDLLYAIKRNKQAILAAPLDHPLRFGLLNNLSILLRKRYSRLGDLQDLEEAIKTYEEAISAAPLDHPQRAMLLDNLSGALETRYGRVGDLKDLEHAIKWGRGAIEATPENHPVLARLTNNLSNRMASRYDHSGGQNLQDLQQAIEWGEKSVEMTPNDHPALAGRLYNLAVTLTSRYSQSGSVRDFYHILRLSYAAWHSHIAIPATRIQAARLAASLLATSKMWQESGALLEGAVRMLPNLSSRSLRREDQEHRLSQFSNLIAESISITFQAGSEAAHCLRLLELGRGIIMGLAIDNRTDFSELRLKHPKEFDTFHRLRVQLDSTPKDDPAQPDSWVRLDTAIAGRESDNQEASYQHERQMRQKAARELDGVLASIRELPGFEGFQLPPRSKDLMSMACEGPIVIVNSTTFRSDAIIVTSSAIEPLALPELHYSAVKENMAQIAKLVQGRRSTYQWRNKKMGEILLWLWDAAVERILKSLNLGTGLPRIWWIGVGPLAAAPFHAAGDHSRGSTRNTISQAVSSYIPTIKALSYARQKDLELLSNADPPRLLLVTMPTTPGQSPLHNSTTEAADIVNIVKGKASTSQLEHPSTAQVLNELPSYHVIHFACHGVSNRESPSDSHLLLCKNDGSDSGTLAIDRLTVGAISNTKLQHAQIAYLSACSTAENSSTTLADESIYIASGFQLAGFSHVLATQWISNDFACREVAGNFYRILFTDKPNASYQGHRKVSFAFHHAIKRLRAQCLSQPIKWACYIHTGA